MWCLLISIEKYAQINPNQLKLDFWTILKKCIKRYIAKCKNQVKNELKKYYQKGLKI